MSSSNSDQEDEGARQPRVFRDRINFILRAADFRERFRLTMDQADNLLSILGPYLDSAETNRNAPMPPDHQLLLALRFFASGESYYSVGDSHGKF